MVCIFACMALSEATSNSPRPKPDWLLTTTTCHPAWLRRAMASRAPGKGSHSEGDLTYSALSSLMVPSRSRMTSFISACQSRQIGHAVHGDVQAFEQALAVQTQVHFFGIDHDTVEECVHRRAQRGEGLQ
jgi:hypothetical protein